MAQARLEHANITVTDPKATAAWMGRVFGWDIRWQGPGMQTGYTVHVGEKDSYLALFSYGESEEAKTSSYRTTAGLNHLAVVVDDLAALEAQGGIRAVNGTRNTWFSGAWMKDGFHEDGLSSGLEVAEAILAGDSVAMAAE